MALKPYIDHKTLKDWCDRTPKVKALFADPDIADRLRLSVARVADDAPSWAMGYMATEDGRIAFRWCHSTETQEKFGVDALNTDEAVFLTARIAQMFELEAAAINLQADLAEMRRVLVDFVAAARMGKKPSDKQFAAAAAILQETGK